MSNIHTFEDSNSNKTTNRENYIYQPANIQNSNDFNNSTSVEVNIVNSSLYKMKKFCTFIIIINFIIFFGELIYFYALKNNTIWTCTLYVFGGKFTPAIINDHHYWRIITSIFLHASIYHILMNSLSIGFLGYFTEKVLGLKKIIILYFCSGIYGNFLSLAIQRNSVGVGASGAIMGFSGFVMIFYIFNLYKMSQRNKNFFIYFFAMTLINLFGNNMTRDGNVVDNYAHLGGFLAGLVISLLFYSSQINYNYFPQNLIQKLKYLSIIYLIISPLISFCYLNYINLPVNTLAKC
jgi:membrane associated rhomboid family serine protease